MSQPVTVIAEIRAKKGKEKEVRELLLGLVPQTHQEEGCLNYDLHETPADPGLFWFHENWVSREALGRHLEMPYIKEMIRRADALLAEPPRIIECRAIHEPKKSAASMR